MHESETGHYVLLEEDGIAKLRMVKTGIRQGNMIQVQTGLKPGEKVIIFGGNNLNDGDKVTVNGKEEKKDKSE